MIKMTFLSIFFIQVVGNQEQVKKTLFLKAYNSDVCSTDARPQDPCSKRSIHLCVSLL